MTHCPKCGFEMSTASESCPRCGVIFGKIRVASPTDITFGKPEASPSPVRKRRLLSHSAKRYMLVAVILILGALFQLYSLRTEKEFDSKPRTMISDDGYSRITIGTDDFGNEVKITEPLRKPMNEAERMAIRRRDARVREAASERAAAQAARRIQEEKAREQ